jgi:hypothetical protein
MQSVQPASLRQLHQTLPQPIQYFVIEIAFVFLLEVKYQRMMVS